MRHSAALSALAGGSALCGAAAFAWAVRGRSSQRFGPSVFRGDRRLRAIALTFDDGPSEGTPAILDVLEKHRASATFFQCGANIRRLPEVARQVLAAGHEIGNHSDTHARMYFNSRTNILAEFTRAQQTIRDTVGIWPRLMRAPFGARWFGFGPMQERLGLLGVMWSVIGRDWALDAAAITDRVTAHASNGSIICLHDGRGLVRNPNVESTVDALRRIIPILAGRGFQFHTVSQLLCQTN